MADTAMQGKAPTLSGEGRDALTSVLQKAVQGGVPALAGAVLSPTGEIFRGLAGELNVARHTPLPPEPIFRLFSLTKPVTSVAAMMLVEEKRLALDDPIARHLPKDKVNQAVITVDMSGHFVPNPPATPITIRHLLTHTSGMSYPFSNDLARRVHENAPSIPETSILVHEPGEAWTYGPSTRTLGEIVAAVSGKSLDVFFAERIFAPLKMSDTGFALTGDKIDRIVTAHERKDGALVELPNAPTALAKVEGDSGLYSTLTDFGRFSRMLLNDGELEGQRLLSAATVKEMSTHQIGALVVTTPQGVSPGTTGSSRPAVRDGFGLGFQIARPERADPRHRSPGTLSWSGAMNTYFWVDPQRRLAAVLLAQIRPFGDEAPVQALERFEEAVYDHVR